MKCTGLFQRFERTSEAFQWLCEGVGLGEAGAPYLTVPVTTVVVFTKICVDFFTYTLFYRTLAKIERCGPSGPMIAKEVKQGTPHTIGTVREQNPSSCNGEEEKEECLLPH